MRVLITGSNGQVGYYLTKQLANDTNIKVLSLDKNTLDITNQEAVIDVVTEFKPTIIINAAAYTAVDKAEEEIELTYAINRDGPKNLAEAANFIGATILHISTDYVFKGDKVDAYEEVDTTDPQGVYGKSKLAGEVAVAEACDRHIILRTSWVFGENGNNFVKTMLRLGAIHGELNVVGDQFGGPTYAGDIADSLIQIARKIELGNVVKHGIYHFSGFPQVSWYDFANTIFDIALEHGILESKPCLNCITTQQYHTPAKRPSNSRLNIFKINNEFSIQASNWKLALTDIQAYAGKI